MLACARAKVLFIHVPRTGGTTLRALLHRHLPEPADLLTQHDNASTVEADFFDGYGACLKFAFVRNPWDRWVSWYALSCRSSARRPGRAVSFADFVENYPTVRRQLGFEPSFLYNQLDYVMDRRGRIVCDVIGRYENFDSDVRGIFDRLGISIGDIPALNLSTRESYRSYYDASLRKTVARLCQKDIDTFGYRF